jgi:hypothetical protein
VNKFLHIGIHFEARKPEIAELVPVFNKALDWVRYAPNNWIVLTSSVPDVWYYRLKPVLHDNDSLFICEIATVDGLLIGTGYLPHFVWEWLKKHRQPYSQIAELPGPDSEPPRSLPRPGSG